MHRGRFRKTVRAVHLIVGLVSGTILLLVAVTGCMLAFEDEIRSATQHDLIYVKPENKPQLPVEQVMAIIKAHDAKLRLSQIRYYGDAGKAIQCYTRDKKIYAVNPYNGSIAGFRDQEKDFLSVVLSLHRTLLLGHIGEKIIFWNACLFGIMLVSGLILWAPRRLKYWRQAVTIKQGTTHKRRIYDWHRVSGFYAFIPLLLMVVTGIDMAASRGKAVPKKSPLQPGTAAVASVYDRALQQAYHGEPLEYLRIAIPKDSTEAIAINIRYQTKNFRKQSNFFFDQYSAKLLSVEPWQQKNFRQRFFGSDYEIHTGRILGLPGKIIVFLAALVVISLPVTGFLIWRGKRHRKKHL
jgi:uncharacterized iron-regulated membrane protein